MSQRINQATGEPLWEVSYLSWWDEPDEFEALAAKTAEAAACDYAEQAPDIFPLHRDDTSQWRQDVYVRAAGTDDKPIAVTVRASLECVAIDSEGVPF